MKKSIQKGLKFIWSKKWFRRFTRTFLGIILTFLIADLLFPLKVKIDYSTSVESSEGNLMMAYLNKEDKWRLYLKNEDISEVLEKTIISKEDAWFYYHPGVNPISIIRAAFNNTIKGKRTSGASTISMQVVRLMKPAKRTFWNKLSEMFRAMQLDLHFSKKEILRMYLNLVPYGGNIEGVKSAALFYFGKSPQKLSLAEAVTLSIIPNRPVSLKIGSNNQKLIKERNIWIERLSKKGLINVSQGKDALLEPLNLSRKTMNPIAPHFCRRMTEEHAGKTVIRTTIDEKLQRSAENILHGYVNGLKGMNIRNGAVMVIDNRTFEVKAYVGSNDYSDGANAGQVDGVKAQRSPGSTLKPLLYSQAFEMGLLTPKSVINDVKVSYNGYEPENYDDKFHGSVTVEYALVNSLNIPAVRVLDMIGLDRFIETMDKAGFKSVKKSKSKMGLSLILGGCGVTLEELCSMYSCFATGGLYHPLKQLYGTPTMSPIRVMTSEASFMTAEILAKITRPDFPNNFQNTYKLPKIAWKTGTSYGRRDAWAIGFNSHYTIGVWLGNFNNEGVPELNGAGMATPLLFELFNSIDYNSGEAWLHQPKALKEQVVCTVTGNAPDVFCTSLSKSYYIDGTTILHTCTHMKEVFVSMDSSYSYCRSCLPVNNYIKKLYPNYEPEMLSYYQDNNIPYKKIPPHNSLCNKLTDNGNLLIVSPQNKSEYFMEKNNPPQLMLQCQAMPDVELVYWYLNDKFYIKCPRSETPFIKPTKGTNKISCTDDKGRTVSISFTVKEI